MQSILTRVSTARLVARRDHWESAMNEPLRPLADPASGTISGPLLKPTIGPEMIDVRGLHAATGRYVFDPGLTETGTCRSAITYVDGDTGILLYRGYPIEQLVEHCDHLEVAWL